MGRRGSRVQVLVVENDHYIRTFVADALTDEGHAVATAPNGEVALAAAARRPPDVILLDMKMPVMDGWELARRYRERPPHAPIFVVSAADNVDQRAAEIGAAGFLGKPFDVDPLVNLVERRAA
jgi:DNA-binding response OmpR family regulator